MLSKKCADPYYSSVVQVDRFLAGGSDDLGFFVVSDFCISATAGNIKQVVFDTGLFNRFQTQYDATPVKTDFIGDFINWFTVSYE